MENPKSPDYKTAFNPKSYQPIYHAFLTDPYPKFWDARGALQNTVTDLPLMKRAEILVGLEEERAKLEKEGYGLDDDRMRQVKNLLELGVNRIKRPLNTSEKKNPYVEKLFENPVFDDDLQGLKMRWEIHLEKYKWDINDLSNIGLDPEKMLSAWEVSGYVLKENLMSTHELEKARPGAPSYLSQMFGIRNFARYPLELLVDQFDDAENKHVPYGIIVNPYYDNYRDRNGHMRAFYQDKEAFSDLSKKLNRRHLLRVLEIEDGFDLIKVLKRLHSTYSKFHKIDFAILGAHGSWKGIRLGADVSKPFSVLEVETLTETDYAKLLKQAFSRNPTLVLNSCDVGAHEGAFAKTLSEKMRANVLAPIGKAESLISLSPFYGTNNNITFQVNFDKSKTAKYKNGQKVN